MVAVHVVGIAHTYMAMKDFFEAAEELDLKLETQGNRKRKVATPMTGRCCSIEIILKAERSI